MPKTKTIIIFLIIFFGVFVFAKVSFAATYTCGTDGVDNSCTISGLNTLISGASDGDTINIATGNHSWTPSLSTYVSVNKRITISGGGSCSTCGDVAQPTGTWPVRINTPSDNTIHVFRFAVTSGTPGQGVARVSGIDFYGGVYRGLGMGCYNAGGFIEADQIHVAQFRIDNNRFQNTTNETYGTTLYICSQQIGLIDHNYFYGSVANDPRGDMRVLKLTPVGYPDSWEGNSCYPGWTQDVNWGGSDWLFVEDNSTYKLCTGTQCAWGTFIDTWGATRIVSRYNYITNAFSESHAFSFGSWSTPAYAMDWYNNTITNTANSFRVYWVRGGTGYFHENNVSGTYGNAVWSTVDAGGDTCTGYGARGYSNNYGTCDGTKAWDGNCEDGGLAYNVNVSVANGFQWNCGAAGAGYHVNYPYLMQPGWGKIQSCAAFGGSEQPEKHEPIRIWSNTHSVIGSIIDVDTDQGDQVTLGRDVFYSTDDSAKPAGYTSFTYPHPLVSGAGGGDTTPPSAPTGLTVQ